MSEIAEKIAREISDYVHGLSMGSQLATWDLKPVVAIIDRHLEPTQPAAPPRCPDCAVVRRELERRGQEIADAMGRYRGTEPLIEAVKRLASDYHDLRAAATPPLDAEQRARAEQIVRGVIVPKGHTIIGVDGEVTILVGRQLIHDIAAALPATDAQRIRDEVWEEAARIAEKPRVVFGTPLTAMHELAQDIAAEIRAKKGKQ